MARSWQRLRYLFTLGAVLFGAACARADEPTVASPTRDEGKGPAAQRGEHSFLRVRRNDRKKAVALDTAVTRYSVPVSGAAGQVASVDLIGAVHVGEKSYYDALNQQFAQYDALLFELVAPEGFEVPEGGRLESQSPVGALQAGLKSFLGLEFQLDCIDYGKQNFVHADMSPEEFQKSMKDRGESVLQMLMRMLGQGLAIQGREPAGATDAELLFALVRRDRATLKRVLAEQLEGMEDSLAVLAGADGGSTIYTERNKKALEVLRRELAGGKRKIGVFYGAGHLDDMETRLLGDFQAQRQETQWLTAWDLTRDHSVAAKQKAK